MGAGGVNPVHEFEGSTRAKEAYAKFALLGTIFNNNHRYVYRLGVLIDNPSGRR